MPIRGPSNGTGARGRNVTLTHPNINTSLSSSNKHQMCNWQPSNDGKYLIGYIVINKSDLNCFIDQNQNQYSIFNNNSNNHQQQLTSSTIGATIIGGRVTASGHIGTIIERIKIGSIADVKCQLRQGDEIAEWNGSSLRNLSFEEALDLMDSTRDVEQIRFVAVRSLINMQNQQNYNNDNNHSHNHHHHHHQNNQQQQQNNQLFQSRLQSFVQQQQQLELSSAIGIHQDVTNNNTNNSSQSTIHVVDIHGNDQTNDNFSNNNKQSFATPVSQGKAQIVSSIGYHQYLSSSPNGASGVNARCNSM